MYILYTDDYILSRLYEEELKQIVADIKAAVLDITEDRDIEYFLGVNIVKLESEKYHLSWPK